MPWPQFSYNRDLQWGLKSLVMLKLPSSVFFEVTQTASVFAVFLKSELSAHEQDTKGIVQYRDSALVLKTCHDVLAYPRHSSVPTEKNYGRCCWSHCSRTDGCPVLWSHTVLQALKNISPDPCFPNTGQLGQKGSFYLQLNQSNNKATFHWMCTGENNCNFM